MVFPPLPIEFSENHSAVIATSSFESNDDTVIDVELSAETARVLLFKSFVVGKELATYKSSYSLTLDGGSCLLGKQHFKDAELEEDLEHWSVSLRQK